VVAARLGYVTSFSQKIFSVSPVNVTLERLAISRYTGRALTYTIVFIQTRLALTVFHSDVSADGLTVVVSFNVRFPEEFGEYQLVIANNIEPDAIRMVEIIPEGNRSYNIHSVITTILDSIL